MVLITVEGTRRRIPAGRCWIDRQSRAPDVCTVHWRELGTDYSAQLASTDLQDYVMGCIVQYA